MSDDEYDFGFTFSSEEEVISTSISPLETEVIELRKRLTSIRKMYMPLLEQLSQQPDKPFIKWPNRKQALDEYKLKLESLTKLQLMVHFKRDIGVITLCQALVKLILHSKEK